MLSRESNDRRISVGRYFGFTPFQTLDRYIFLAIVLVSYIGLLLCFGWLFPLVEFRDWTFAQFGLVGDIDYLIRSLWDGFIRLYPYSRPLSLGYAVAVIDVCEPNIRCMNALVLLPVAIASGLLYTTSRRFGAGIVLSIVAVAMWLASDPVGNTLAWQATILDRVTLVMILTTVLVYLRFAAAPLGLFEIVGCNLVIGLLTAGSLMSKEAAFPLPGVLLLLALSEIGHKAGRVQRLLGLILPVTYSLFYEISYLSNLSANVNWADHTTGGNVAANLMYYASVLFPEKGTGRNGILIVALAVLLPIFIGVVYFRWGVDRRNHPVGRIAGHSALVLVVSGILFLLPVVAAKGPAAYYLYIPFAFLVLAYVALAAAAVNQMQNNRLRAGLAVGTILLPIFMVSNFFWAASRPYISEVRASRNFIRSFAQLDDEVHPSGKSIVAMVVQPGDFAPHIFVMGKLNGLWRYIDPVVARDIDPEVSVLMVSDIECPSAPWDVCVRYDSQMRLIDIQKSG